LLNKNDYRYENITLVETKQAYLENSIVKLFQTQVQHTLAFGYHPLPDKRVKPKDPQSI